MLILSIVLNDFMNFHEIHAPKTSVFPAYLIQLNPTKQIIEKNPG